MIWKNIALDGSQIRQNACFVSSQSKSLHQAESNRTINFPDDDDDVNVSITVSAEHRSHISSSVLLHHGTCHSPVLVWCRSADTGPQKYPAHFFDSSRH